MSKLATPRPQVRIEHFRLRHQRLPAGGALGRFERLVDKVHAVITADRHEVRAHLRRLSKSVDKSVVGRGTAGCRIVVAGDNPERYVSHAIEDIVIGYVVRSDQADTGLVQPRSENCFAKDAPTPEGTNTNTASGAVSRTGCRKGDCSVMMEVAAAMTIIGTLSCVAMGAVARASGVKSTNAARHLNQVSCCTWVSSTKHE